MAEAKPGTKKTTSLTNQLVKKWSLSNSPKSGLFFDKSKIETAVLTKITKKFLDFNEKELSSIVKDFLVKGKYMEGARDEQQLNFAIFSIIQIVRYISPEDNNEFILKALIHLRKNPLFCKVVLGLIQTELYKLEKGQFNLPELGIFAAPGRLNKYTFAIPFSPLEAILVFVGNNTAAAYKDEEMVNLSFATPKQKVLLHESQKEMTAHGVLAIQKENEKKIGNLLQQMEDPESISNVLKSMVGNLPGVKNNIFLHKPLEMAMKLWQNH